MGEEEGPHCKNRVQKLSLFRWEKDGRRAGSVSIPMDQSKKKRKEEVMGSREPEEI